MKLITVLVVAAALLAPVAALADSTTPSQNASRDCTALKAKMGALAFGQAYASFGACVSSLTPLEQNNVSSAQSACTAEQNDANFAATHDGKTFAQFYGTGKSGSNAFGRCVSGKANASSQAEQHGRLNPAQTCRAERTQMGTAAFTKLYGSNASGKNAFGKCVSAAARAQTRNELSASSSCKTEQAADESAFATKYGTNVDNSNAFGECVSSHARDATAVQEQAKVNAAKACYGELKSIGSSAFDSKYGTFGRCVSSKATTK
jgi:hypothetical protein